MAQANGLLDWIQTPAGIGLLSAVAGGMAGAQRGTPWNNAGRAGIAGLAGYTGAKDQINKESDNALTRQYRQMQMQELESKIAQQKALREAATSAYQDATKPAQFSVGGQTFPDQQAAQMSAESMFSLPSSAVPDSNQPLMNFQSEQAPANIADFSGGQTPQITQQQAPDVRSAMYSRLMQAGFPEEASKYAPDTKPVVLGKTLINPSTGETIAIDGTWKEEQAAAREQRIQELNMRLEDQRLNREQQIALRRELAGQQAAYQRESLNLRRDTLAQGNKPPAGYRYTPEGNLEAIKGGPADIKAGELGAKQVKQKELSIAQAGSVLNEVKDAQKLVGYSTVGVGGALRGLPMTPARDLDAKLTSIKANLGFDRLQQMRDASPTGGALGQVAVQELVALQSTVASLDQLQSPEQMRAALKKIETHYTNWQKTLQGGKQPAPNNLPGGWTVKEL